MPELEVHTLIRYHGVPIPPADFKKIRDLAEQFYGETFPGIMADHEARQASVRYAVEVLMAWRMKLTVRKQEVLGAPRKGDPE